MAVDADEPGIGNGNAMGVAPKIGQYPLGPRKWRLGIDGPVNTARIFNGSVECDRIGQPRDIAEKLKPPHVAGLLGFLEEKPPEQARQDPHGQKEGCPAGNPTRLVERKSAARRDAVDMRVIREVPPPRVRHRDKAGPGAQMPGSAAILRGVQATALNRMV